jgi:hypothetical protein
MQKWILSDFLDAHTIEDEADVCVYSTMLAETYRRANLVCDDPRTNVVASVWMPETRVGLGYVMVSGCGNSFCRGCFPKDKNESLNWKTSKKHMFIEHAEKQALFRALEVIPINILRSDALMVAPWFACVDCAKTMAAIGPQIIIGHYDYYDFYSQRTNGKWDSSILEGFEILERAGKTMKFVKGSVKLQEPIMVAGSLFAP